MSEPTRLSELRRALEKGPSSSTPSTAGWQALRRSRAPPATRNDTQGKLTIWQRSTRLGAHAAQSNSSSIPIPPSLPSVSDRADSEPDDPRPRNQEQRFLRCRDPREAQGKQVQRPIVGEFLKGYPSVQIRYLLLNETCCTKEIPNDTICRPPAHN